MQNVHKDSDIDCVTVTNGVHWTPVCGLCLHYVLFQILEILPCLKMGTRHINVCFCERSGLSWVNICSPCSNWLLSPPTPFSSPILTHQTPGLQIHASCLYCVADNIDLMKFTVLGLDWAVNAFADNYESHYYYGLKCNHLILSSHLHLGLKSDFWSAIF